MTREAEPELEVIGDPKEWYCGRDGNQIGIIHTDCLSEDGCVIEWNTSLSHIVEMKGRWVRNLTEVQGQGWVF